MQLRGTCHINHYVRQYVQWGSSHRCPKHKGPIKNTLLFEDNTKVCLFLNLSKAHNTIVCWHCVLVFNNKEFNLHLHLVHRCNNNHPKLHIFEVLNAPPSSSRSNCSHIDCNEKFQPQKNLQPQEYAQPTDKSLTKTKPLAALTHQT